MDRVRVFLRTALFTVSGEIRHAPEGAVIVEGRVREILAGGLILEVSVWRREDGRVLDAPAATIYLPSAKIDHVLLQ